MQVSVRLNEGDIMKTRYPAVAGSFYPDDAIELKTIINQYLVEATSHEPCHTEACPKAIIAPHAGYIYSGLTAAFAYQNLARFNKTIRKVILLGPAHRVAFRGIAIPDCEEFASPLGMIPLDHSAFKKVSDLSYVHVLPEAHRLEHSLEVQLPFLQMVLKNITLAPFVVGDASTEEVATLIERLWGGDETLIVISSDLSHYHPYKSAQLIDAATSHDIEQLKPTLVGEQACGCRALNGLLSAAKHHNLQVTTLDLRNSGDTAGSKDAVVGYGAYALQ